MRPNDPKIEPLLESDVLARYDLPEGKVSWRSHDMIGLDDVAHYFTLDGSNYVLVWNDFPNETFIHEERLPPVRVRGGSDEWLHIETGDGAGYYTLYKDIPATKHPK